MSKDTEKSIAHENITEEDESASKREKIEREKKELLACLASADFTAQKTKVAYILNLYPESRNSDIALTLKYWEVFQSDIYNPAGIPPESLFKLERMHYLVRARAKIQNEYNLFTASTDIKRFRRKHEEKMLDTVRSDPAPRKVIKVYADETGKTQNFIIVSSVWVLTGRAVFTVSQAIKEWQLQSRWATREVHFNKLGKHDLETLREYLGVVVKNREFLSFKSIAVERARSRRTVENIVEKLHENILNLGIEHEINSNRVGLPQKVEMTIDHEQSLDPISLEELKRRVNLELQKKYSDDVELSKIEAISSRTSQLVQLSDMLAGAINRKLNCAEKGNFKDDMADMILQMLDVELENSEIGDLDTSALFKL
jgi:hypothetical protein